MSFNPVLARARPEDTVLFPFIEAPELIVLMRDNIGAELYSGGKKYKGYGRVYLTNRRLVFIKDGDVSKQTQFASLEFPLNHIHGKTRDTIPEFHQPVFGANYIGGKILRKESADFPIPTDGDWSFTFKHGGCEKFLTAFHNLWRNARTREENNLQAEIMQTAFGGRNSAFIDPSDPSVIYTTQPSPNYAYQWNNNGYTPLTPQAPPVQYAQPAPPGSAPPVYMAYPPPQGYAQQPYPYQYQYPPPPGGAYAPQGYQGQMYVPVGPPIFYPPPPSQPPSAPEPPTAPVPSPAPAPAPAPAQPLPQARATVPSSHAGNMPRH